MHMLHELNVKVLVYAPTKTKTFLEEYGAEQVNTQVIRFETNPIRPPSAKKIKRPTSEYVVALRSVF